MLLGRLFPRIGRGLLDLAFPPGCAACDVHLDDSAAAMCADCAAGLARQVSVDYCGCCGADAAPYLLRDGRCSACRGSRPGYERVIRIGRYEHVLRKLVLRFKYGGTPILDALLGDLMLDALAIEPSAGSIECWVPAPSALRRTWQRGYQPTRLLADRIARRTGRPRRTALVLARPIQPQKELPADRRTANVSGAFVVPRPDLVAGRVVAVVDDVFTTGATMREAARALRAAGAAGVLGVVVAAALPGEDHAPGGRGSSRSAAADGAVGPIAPSGPAASTQPTRRG